MALAYISLGSNLGDREENIKNAVTEINNLRKTTVLAVSVNYETDPVGYTEQGKFINAVIKIDTGLKPEELLTEFQTAERKLGRTETIKWGPRIIDIDILIYENLIIDTDNLRIPHPLMHERYFVMKPLSEIAPEEIHPILNKTFKSIYEEYAINS
jgi:2-amino-4-hydroxy-6-hydroxymethyldihydropteridine diphosphokinase